MNELIRLYLIVCPLIFLGGFVDSVTGGGGLITLPAYLMAGIPAHTAMGTNKIVNAVGTGILDLAVTTRCYRKALELGKGTTLHYWE